MKCEQNPNQGLRYVIYARKSSEDEGSQAKSLPDQINECMEYASRKGLNVVGQPIEEAKSAKVSGRRDKFKFMLSEIKRGRYDAILAYHPDRLARNSLEAGMVVDMVDNGIIKDLKFPTVEFTNDSSGKLMLNILFAMSKQYSEHLSESVQRGIDSNFKVGRSAGIPKWGYTTNIKGDYEPDENFEAIQQGWEMLLRGKTRKEILEYWASREVHRMTKRTRSNRRIRRIDLTNPTTTTNIFTDPFYYGILIQAGKMVDLREVNPHYKPMITKEKYDMAQRMMSIKNRRMPERMLSRGDFYVPLKHMVKCAHCGHYMMPGRSKSRGGKYYVYIRCDNKECSQYGKGVRLNIVLEAIYKALDGLKMTEEDYAKFCRVSDEYIKRRWTQRKVEINSLRGEISQIKRERDQKAKDYVDFSKMATTPESVLTMLANEQESLTQELVEKQAKVKKMEEDLIDPDSLKFDRADFLNTINSVADKMRSGTPAQKDLIVQNMFLNLTVDNQKRVSYLWQEPFNEVSKHSKISSGARDWT